MGRPKTVLGEVETSTRLLAAAENAFAAHGYDGARLQAIAEEAGISRPSLLYHFGSKHALYCAVIRSVFEAMAISLRESLGVEGGFAVKLDSVLKAFSRFVEGRPSAARLVLREVLDDRGPGHDLLLESGLPLLHMVERFIRDQGAGVVPEGIPVKDALLQLVAGAFVKAASGPLKATLWGPEDTTPDIARFIFLGAST